MHIWFDQPTKKQHTDRQNFQKPIEHINGISIYALQFIFTHSIFDSASSSASLINTHSHIYAHYFAVCYDNSVVFRTDCVYLFALNARQMTVSFTWCVNGNVFIATNKLILMKLRSRHSVYYLLLIECGVTGRKLCADNFQKKNVFFFVLDEEKVSLPFFKYLLIIFVNEIMIRNKGLTLAFALNQNPHKFSGLKHEKQTHTTKTWSNWIRSDLFVFYFVLVLAKPQEWKKREEKNKYIVTLI